MSLDIINLCFKGTASTVSDSQEPRTEGTKAKYFKKKDKACTIDGMKK